MGGRAFFVVVVVVKGSMMVGFWHWPKAVKYRTVVRGRY